LWNNNFLVKREQIKSYSKKIEDLENLPSIGDYCLLGWNNTELCKVIKKERIENFRWASIDYEVKKMNPGPHDGPGIVKTDDGSMKYWSSSIIDMESIIASKKFNL
jgi:hypothetical protein